MARAHSLDTQLKLGVWSLDISLANFNNTTEDNRIAVSYSVACVVGVTLGRVAVTCVHQNRFIVK